MINVGGARPGQVVLGFIRKQADEAVENRPVHSLPPRPPLQFLPLCSRPEFSFRFA